ncbi:hypothetical protein AMATHDRAFT_1210 [Amanita thiersii Skay4041]|uniref:Cerato-platanin n=1 Tax=Amanita thiersii Skay4041 TaxID=703135 RepID=A0A2A9NTY4_9AGAR|nr:hypothetical protein AMATHDRAFT_1210 [Amanita thiersii Skay4041]
MRFFTTLTSLVLLCASSQATTATLAYDPVYDDGGHSLSTVTCSNGPYGLLNRGFTNFASLPNFPNIGAASVVTGWTSDKCGSCWQLTYTPPRGPKRSIYMLAIDGAPGGGFVTGLRAMNYLTNNRAIQLGRVDVVSRQVHESKCSLSDREPEDQPEDQSE